MFVSDCSDLFSIYVRTDNVGDAKGAAAPTAYSRGNLLNKVFSNQSYNAFVDMGGVI